MKRFVSGCAPESAESASTRRLIAKIKCLIKYGGSAAPVTQRSAVQVIRSSELDKRGAGFLRKLLLPIGQLRLKYGRHPSERDRCCLRGGAAEGRPGSRAGGALVEID